MRCLHHPPLPSLRLGRSILNPYLPPPSRLQPRLRFSPSQQFRPPSAFLSSTRRVATLTSRIGSASPASTLLSRASIPIPSTPHSSPYSSSPSSPRNPTPTSGRSQARSLLWATALFLTVATGAFVARDTIKHKLDAIHRSVRVASTLAVCINDYRVTLRHENDDPEVFRALLKACHKRCAERTLEVMEQNGSIFIKLGQHLSSMNYILPIEWCETFIPLQDKCPVSSIESIEAMVLADTGKSISAWFSEFEEKPIGAASLAQVHRATLRETGEQVAVKVQHPVLDEWAKLDIALTRFTFRSVKRWFPEYDLTWLSEEMETSLPQELDFNHEAFNTERVRAYFSHLPNLPLVIPKVHWSQRRILVMEYITGARPDDLDYLDRHNISRDEVADSLACIFNEMIFGRDAPLHCDPHGGNLAIRYNPARQRWSGSGNFDVVLYDHGLYRDIPLETRRKYAKLWLAVLAADVDGMRRYAHELAGINESDFKLFASAITGKPFDAIREGLGSASSLSRDRRADHAKMSAAIGIENGMLSHLILMLGQVPKIILLILKTNDLTRSLCEGLNTDLGPIRTILTLGRYAARCVYEEQIEAILDRDRTDVIADGTGVVVDKGGVLTVTDMKDGIHTADRSHALTRPIARQLREWSIWDLCWPPSHFISAFRAWTQYTKMRTSLAIFQFWLDLRALLGLRPITL